MEEVLRQLVASVVREEFARLKSEILEAIKPTDNNLIRGDKALAEALGCSKSMISKLNHQGRLDGARVKISRGLNAYDLDKVKELLKV